MKLSKILAMLLALAMILCCFAACDFSSDDDEDEDEEVEEKDKDEDEEDEDEDEDADLDFDFSKGDKDDEDEEETKRPVRDDEDEAETTRPVDTEKVEIPVQRPSDEDSIVGTWSGNLNYANMVKAKLKVDVPNDLYYPITIQFYSNGTYRQTVKNASDREIKDFTEDYIVAMFEYSMNMYGYTDAEQFAKANGYASLEDCYDMLREQANKEFETQKTNLQNMNTTNTYEYDNGVLEFDGGASIEVDLDGDRLEFLESSNNAINWVFKGVVMERQ